ncbi:MAG: 3-hydroxyacyl-CoA dehydrogenase NAD-binding domain-containing protein [Candidatus Hodarchaeales archaeon]|jgi:enoyl-CoA hydratase/3-hydroxyacyl-CoA dehydrogenase
MNIDDIKTVAVVGAGDMGHGIAQAALQAGYKVSLYDIEDEFVEKGKGRIDWSLGKFEEKGRIAKGERDKFMGNLTTFIDLQEAVKDADLIIEAAPEILELKKEIFGNLEKFAPKHAILSTNTSNMSINELGSATERPEKVAGMHFFNPVVLMQLVEITRGEKTSDETTQILEEMTKKMKKTSIVCRKDSPGFIVNRINGPSGLYLQLLVDKGKYTPEQIDSAANQLGLPMGVFLMIDNSGVDIVYHSMNYLKDRLHPDYKPTPTLDKMIEEKKLGKKTGEGFYKWPEVGRPVIDTSIESDFDMMGLLKIQINEAAKILEEGLCTADEIDTGMKLGMSSFGPMEMADGQDMKELTEFLDGVAEELGTDIFKAHKYIRDGTLLDVAKGATEVKEEKKADEFETIRLERDPDNYVTTMVIDRPYPNTINEQVLDDMSAAIDLLWDDKKTRVIVLRGENRCFSAGFELDIAKFLDADSWDAVKMVRKGQYTFKKLRDIPKVVIAAIQRYCLAGGLELALSCDIRIASEKTKLGLTEVGLGIIPGWGGTQNLRRHIGLGRTMEMVLTAKRIDAEDAEEIGLVNKEVDEDEFDEYVDKYAKKVAKLSAPISVGLAKRLVNQAAEVPLDIGLQMEAMGAGIAFLTEDAKEGIMSLFQKKEPEFQEK